MTNALESFRCCKDDDIETFLRTKAFLFLDKALCSVYLILDEHAFDEGKILIVAYFTLSHKSLISEGLSRSTVGKLTGGFRDTKSLHFVLIGQLGKFMKDSEDGSVVCSNISSTEILDFAFEAIREASNLIPCRLVLVECSDNSKVQKVYQDYGFTHLQHDERHHQYYKSL